MSLYFDILLDIHSVSQSQSHMSSATALYVSSMNMKWKSITPEKVAWEKLQICLDTFFQRMTVVDGGEKERQAMRQWYEAIMDIGSQFF